MLFKFVYKHFFYNSSRTMSVFTQRLNPITGQFTWEVQNEDYDYHQEVARTDYGDMLHDYERNQKYESALKIAINHMHAQGKPANVLDIGTGTGLLSMMAVRNGADSVVACEAFEPMSKCAKKVIARNGYSDKITVISKRSTEIKVGEDKDMKFPANILITEVFDTELIGEGAFSTFKLAHDNLLEADCIVIPNTATMFAQVVESPFINNWNRLKDIFDNEGKLLLKVPSSFKTCKGSANLHDIQLGRVNKDLFNTIISPKAIFKFDWSGKTPLAFKRSNVQSFRAESSGIAQAVFMWWELGMDIENKIILSCAPYWAHPDEKNCPWRDHWMQAVYYFPQEVKVIENETLQLISSHDEYSLWFNIEREHEIAQEEYSKPECDCSLHWSCSRTRIGQMNDSIRTKKFVKLMKKYINGESIVLVLGHGFYHALIALSFGAKKLVFVREYLTPVVERFIEANVLDKERVLVLDDRISAEKFNVVLAEPFFTTGIIPWDHLQFVYQCDKYRNLYDDNVRIFPRKAVVRGVAVEFEHLYKLRAPLGTCEGFKMDDFDSLVQKASAIADDAVDAQPLWEYKACALSEVVDVAVLDLAKLSVQDVLVKGTVDLKGTGKCNGIALWVDWVMDDEEDGVVISTGPTGDVRIDEDIKWNLYIRQGVHFLKARDSPCTLDFSFKFEYKVGLPKFSVKNPK